MSPLVITKGLGRAGRTELIMPIDIEAAITRTIDVELTQTITVEIEAIDVIEIDVELT